MPTVMAGSGGYRESQYKLAGENEKPAEAELIAP
jgi:hypothetical protein